MKLENIKKDILGYSFTAKFPGMKKPQTFSVYPATENSVHRCIQSENRIGYIDTSSGKVIVTKALTHHPGFVAFQVAQARGQLVRDSIENIEEFNQVVGTSTFYQTNFGK